MMKTKLSFINNLRHSASAWITACRDKSKKTLPPGSTATVTVLALFALCFAQVKNFNPKEEVTTSRTIITLTRELAENYPPDAGISKGSPLIIEEDLLETGARGNPIVVKAGKYHFGKTSYPPGTKARILKPIKERGKPDQFVILIGKTREQIIVPPEAILEAGGIPGPPIKTKSIQTPRELSTQYWDGPEGIWTGLAVGDEDIESNREDEQIIFRMVNQIRANRGISPLIWDEDLARAARYHAADCYTQGYMEHITLDGFRIGKMQEKLAIASTIKSVDDPSDRVNRFVNSRRRAIAENIAQTKSNESAVQGWMASPGHRANILDPSLRRTGIGCIGKMTGKRNITQVQVFSD